MMTGLATFSGAAKGLARNPLGIIALFIVLIYGFAALTLGITQSLTTAAQMHLVWFLVIFPFGVLSMFGWLVSKHHEKLYAPSDYKSDEGFLIGVEARARRRVELQAQQDQLKANLRQKILASDIGHDGSEQLADQLAEEVERSTTFKIDAREFLGNSEAIYTFPVAAYETLDELSDEIYFKLSAKVRPYEYGYSWVLRNKTTGTIIRNARMITDAPAGKPLADNRSLGEVGIKAGVLIEVVAPPTGTLRISHE